MATHITTDHFSSHAFISNRGQNVVYLFRTTGNHTATDRLGRLYCVVPDANDTNQTIYVNIGE